MTVLLVEDEPGVREVASLLMETLGYQVIEACNPRDAIAKFRARQSQIDIVLTDFLMPEMNGAQLAGTLAAARPDLKFVFMSGYSEETVPSELALHLLSKPFTRAMLAEALHDAAAFDQITQLQQ